MKAKEYVETYFGNVTKDSSRELFYNQAESCFRDFWKEQQTALLSLEKTTSIVAKLKEFKTKWDRIGILVSGKYFYDLKDIEEDVSVIDRVCLVTFCDLWSEHMKEHYPAILPAIKSPRVDVASNRLHSQVQ